MIRGDRWCIWWSRRLGWRAVSVGGSPAEAAAVRAEIGELRPVEVPAAVGTVLAPYPGATSSTATAGRGAVDLGDDRCGGIKSRAY